MKWGWISGHQKELDTWLAIIINGPLAHNMGWDMVEILTQEAMLWHSFDEGLLEDIFYIRTNVSIHLTLKQNSIVTFNIGDSLIFSVLFY